MATPESQAKQTWQHTLKLRKLVLKQIDKLKTESAHGTNLTQFDAIGDSLEQYRLGCVSTIFTDFTYAASENVDEILWQVHATLNSEFRRVLSRLKNHAHVVERRKVESRYNHFLRIAVQFYRGYVQRLSARYDIPELSRVATGMDTEQMPGLDRISPVSPELSATVLKSCHITLIHLGDLARYKIQARHKKTGFETALTCYSLAHDLIPESGFAFHQMGIINIDEENHLEIVYLFYRAWAVKEPHPNAKQNLEAKFKALQAPNGSARGKSPVTGPHDALVMWFLKLHALFYKGVSVPQQAELDREVMHRLSNAVKDPSCASLLFKMSLVNMAAFCIALDDYRNSQTETASRFCQFTLSFTVRFISKLCESVENDIKESFQRKEKPPGAEAAQSDASESTPTPIVEAFLPILRVYAMWLAAQRREIFSATEVLGSILPPMLRSFTTVFTLLAVDVYSQTDLRTCPYLLPEDLDIRGLRSFDADRASPVSIRTHCTDDGKLKPHLPHPSQRLPAKREQDARILDALRCVYQLADDRAVPLAARVAENWLIFEYVPLQEPVPCEQQKDTPSSDQAISAGSTQKAVNRVDDVHQTALEQSFQAQKTPQAASKTDRKDEIITENPVQKSVPAGPSLNDADKTIVDMLSPFLEDPPVEGNETGTGLASSTESSYGIHTSTANELAQELLTKFKLDNEGVPRQDQTSGSGLFDSGIWNWDFPYGSTAGLPNQRSTQAAAAERAWSNHGSNRSSRALLPVPETMDTPFSSPRHRPHSAVRLRASDQTGSPATRPLSREDAHRSQLLQAFIDPTTRQTPSQNWGQDPWARDTNGSNTHANASAWSGSDQRHALHLPSSSNASAFTHMSSLYHGTPERRMNFDEQVLGGVENPQRLSGSQRDQSAHMLPAHRYLQMDATASSYDAAILQAAWQNNG